MNSRQQRYSRRTRNYKRTISDVYESSTPSQINIPQILTTEPAENAFDANVEIDISSLQPPGMHDMGISMDRADEQLSDESEVSSNESLQSTLENNFDVPIFHNSPLTVRDSAFEILRFVRKYKMSAKVINGLLSLIRFHLPTSNVFPSSRYYFEKVISQTSERMTSIRHYYCNNCFKTSEHPGLCGICNTSFEYFIEFPLVDQLRKVLLRCLEDESRKGSLTSGARYKSIVTRSCFSQISLQLNIDGAPMFSTSSKSFTPALMRVNEIGYLDSCKNIIVAGIWFGDKCNVDLFLRGLIQQWKDLETDGIMWTDKSGNEHHTKVCLILCSVDAPMRASIQGMKQYNGRYGCGQCEHPGSVVKGCVVYDYMDSIPLRTSTGTNFICEHFTDCDNRKGILRRSMLTELGFFDIIRSCPPDYLHAVLLGVMRKLLIMWTKSSFHNKPWYIGNQLTQLDSLLLNCKPNNNVKRCPRTIKELKFWRANEFKNFLLLWGPVLLRTFLKVDFYNHFMLLSSGIHLLLKENITNEDLREATYSLTAFSIHTETLYGKEFSTYNNHQILHLPLSVHDWGPLWSWSTAPFESFLYFLKSSVHGSREILAQMSRIISDYTLLNNDEISTHGNQTHVSGATCFGPFETLSSIVGDDFNVHSFQRLFWKHSLFLTVSNNKSKKRISYVAEIVSTENLPTFGKILNFVVKSPPHCTEPPCMDHGAIYAQMKLFTEIRRVEYLSGGTLLLDNQSIGFPHVFQAGGSQPNPLDIPIENLSSLCVLVECDSTFILKLSNTLDKNL